MKATKLSIGRRMVKEVVVHIHNVILLNYKWEHIWVNSNEVDKLESIIQSEVNEKEKHQYSMLLSHWHDWIMSDSVRPHR